MLSRQLKVIIFRIINEFNDGVCSQREVWWRALLLLELVPWYETKRIHINKIHHFPL